MIEDIDKYLHEYNPFDFDFLERVFGFEQEEDANEGW